LWSNARLFLLFFAKKMIFLWVLTCGSAANMLIYAHGTHKSDPHGSGILAFPGCKNAPLLAAVHFFC
jgi:hypothetical protein